MPNASGPMACPVDGAILTMSERSGIEIDYCPTCRGVWLDRGELDKIIERNAQDSASSAQLAPQAQHAPPPQYQQDQPQAPWGQQQQPYGSHGYGHKPHKRRKGFLEELFD